LGTLYDQEGDWKMALMCYQRAVTAEPDYAEAYFNQGVIYWRQKRWAQVVASFEATLKILPKHPSARRYLEQARGLWALDKAEGTP